jgi:hypothetical protein
MYVGASRILQGAYVVVLQLSTTRGGSVTLEVEPSVSEEAAQAEPGLHTNINININAGVNITLTWFHTCHALSLAMKPHKSMIIYPEHEKP